LTTLIKGESFAIDTIHHRAYLERQLQQFTENGVSIFFMQEGLWLSLGLMLLALGGEKPQQLSYRHHYMCFLTTGQLIVAYGNNDRVPQTLVSVTEGCFWEILRGNCYSLKNLSRKACTLLVYLRVNNTHD
jgi:hypothetical protein